MVCIDNIPQRARDYANFDYIGPRANSFHRGPNSRLDLIPISSIFVLHSSQIDADPGLQPPVWLTLRTHATARTPFLSLLYPALPFLRSSNCNLQYGEGMAYCVLLARFQKALWLLRLQFLEPRGGWRPRGVGAWGWCGGGVNVEWKRLSCSPLRCSPLSHSSVESRNREIL